MGYTEEQLKGFRAKDLRISKVAMVKSYLEGCGKLPTKEQIDEAILLIYEQTDQDKKIIKGDIPAVATVESPAEPF